MIEREIKARLNIESTGEKRAFKDAADDAEHLNDAVGKTGPTLEQTRQKLGQLGERLKKVFQATGIEDLSDGLDRAGQEVGDFLREAQAGTGGLEEMATRSKLALTRLQEEVKAARQEGRRLSAEQREQLQQLEKDYQRAIREAGRFKAAQIASTREIDIQASKSAELTGSIGSLSDVLSLSSGRFGSFAIKVGAGASALAAGFDAGTQFRGMLESIDQHLNTKLLSTLDQFVQKNLGVQAAMDRLFGANQNPAQEAQLLQQVLQQLAELGVEPVSNNLAELIPQLERARREMAEQRGGITTVVAGYDEWRKQLNLLPEDLDKATSDLARFVQLLLEQNENLDRSRLGENLKPQIDALVESYRTLGQEVPAELQGVIETLGLLEEATGETGKSAQLLEEYRGKLQGVLSGVTSDVGERAKQIQKAFGEIRFEDFNRKISLLMPEARDQLAREMEQMIQIMRDAGVEVSDEAIAIAKSTGAVIPSFEPVQRAAGETADSLSGVETAGDGAGRAAGEAAPKMAELGTASGSAADDLGRMADELERIQRVQLDGLFGPFRQDIAQTREALKALEADLDRIREKAQQPLEGATA